MMLFQKAELEHMRINYKLLFQQYIKEKNENTNFLMNRIVQQYKRLYSELSSS